MMANRPVYEAVEQIPFYKQMNIDFQFYSGFSITQKQKSIESLHTKYCAVSSGKKILEISSKSPLALGVELSAFNLKIHTKKSVFSVECAFQGSKVFQNGGPYKELLSKTSLEAKKYDKLRTSGKLIAFKYYDKEFPLFPRDYFYNWLYINALNLNEKLSNEILNFDCFSDIEFNPQKSINCQAKAAAIFVGLSKSGLLQEATKSKEDFLRVVYGDNKTERCEQLFLDLNN